MRRFWRWMVSIVFIVTVVSLIEITFFLVFKKPLSEPWKTILQCIGISLGMLLAFSYDYFKIRRFLKKKTAKNSDVRSQEEGGNP